MNEAEKKPIESRWRRRLHEIIFEAETVGGKTFDVLLLWTIIISVAVVILESVKSIRADYGRLLLGMGYAIIAVPTGIVTVEFSRSARAISTRFCSECHTQDHDADAIFCKYCASKL